MVTQNTDNDGTQTPFATGAPLYREPVKLPNGQHAAKWPGVFPLRAHDKRPAVSGYHGPAAPYADGATVAQWCTDYPAANVGQHLAGIDSDHELIGVDVDHYLKGGKQKTGGTQLESLESKHGKLPETWTSSARSDGMSGIRYFRVPRGLKWPSYAPEGNDIDIVSKGHKYAAVWPSLHPGCDEIEPDTPYWWFPPGVAPDEAGQAAWDGTLPDPRTFPVLPDAWIDFLTNGRAEASAVDLDSAATVTEIDTWAEDTFNDGSSGVMCSVVRDKIDKHKARITDEASSHDKAKDFHWSLYQLAAEGHTGWADGIRELNGHYAREVIDRDKRAPDELSRELFRSRTRALRKIKAEVESLKAFGVQSPPRVCACRLSSDPGRKVFAKFLKQVADFVAQQPKPVMANPAGSEVHAGHVRIAYRLARRNANTLVFVNGIGWHYWDGQRWAFDDRGRAKRAVIAVLRDSWNEAFTMTDAQAQKRLISDTKTSSSSAGIAGVLSVASALEPFAATVRELDTNAYALNVANGTLDLQTFELRKHQPGDGITKTCRGAFDPNTIIEGSLWDQFLKRILPDTEVRHYLQRLIGVALLGKVKEHMLPILTGEGRNGKGTFYEALLFALGDYGGTAEPDLFMHREGAHPTGQMDLRGRRLVVVSENDRDRRLAEATMKRLTGGDPIKARYMRENFVEFNPSHLALLVTNHLPRVTGDDPAVWARMRVIPFDVVIPKAEQDGNLGEKLEAEADAILAWAVAGYKDYLRRGTAEPPTVLAATERYRTDSDDVGRFITACCETDPRAHFTQATSSELHRAWEEWQMEDGCPKIGLKAFGKILDGKGFHVLPASHGRREREGIGLTVVSGRTGMQNVNDHLAQQT